MCPSGNISEERPQSIKHRFSVSYVKIIGAVFSVHIEKRFPDPVKQSVSLFENVLDFRLQYYVYNYLVLHPTHMVDVRNTNN